MMMHGIAMKGNQHNSSGPSTFRVLPDALTLSDSASNWYRYTPTTLDTGTTGALTDVDEDYLSTDDYGFHCIFGSRNAKFEFANDGQSGSSSGVTIYAELAFARSNGVQTDPFEITVGLYIGGVLKGTESLTSLTNATSGFPKVTGIETLTNAGWDAAWTESERNGAYVLITYVSGTGKNEGMWIGACNIEWTI